MLFLEGLLSFLSPCLLPMLPVYVLYFAGEQTDAGARLRTVLGRSIAFVLGFSVVFIAMGVFAGSFGAALAAHRNAVNVGCGALIAVFGLSFLGVVRLPFKGMSSSRRITGIWSAFVFGLVFSLGLTPCVGAFLGAALMTAASEGGALKGAGLLAEYSLGLGIPFVVSALMIDRLKMLLGFFKANARWVSVFSGVLLIVFGVWTAGRDYLPASTSSAGVDERIEKSQNSGLVKEDKNMEVVLNAANFEAEVLKSEKPVMVDFWATWCGPCRMLAPELEALAAERSDIKVGKVNVDENPELCAKYGITSIPAIFVFKNGQVVKQAVGYRSKAELEQLLK